MTSLGRRKGPNSLLLLATLCVLAACCQAVGDALMQSCQQRIRGQSVMYGQRPASTAAYLDQARIAAVTKAGRLAKVNTYYSPDGCVTGVKPVYEVLVGVSQLMGVQQGMKERSLVLAESESINRVDIRYDTRCITYMRWYTNTSRTMTVGSAAATPSSKMAAVTPGQQAYQLIAFRALLANNGDLAQLQLVWGEVVCAAPGAVLPPSPAEPAVAAAAALSTLAELQAPEGPQQHEAQPQDTFTALPPGAAAAAAAAADAAADEITSAAGSQIPVVTAAAQVAQRPSAPGTDGAVSDQVTQAVAPQVIQPTAAPAATSPSPPQLQADANSVSEAKVDSLLPLGPPVQHAAAAAADNQAATPSATVTPLTSAGLSPVTAAATATAAPSSSPGTAPAPTAAAAAAAEITSPAPQLLSGTKRSADSLQQLHAPVTAGTPSQLPPAAAAAAAADGSGHDTADSTTRGPPATLLVDSTSNGISAAASGAASGDAAGPGDPAQHKLGVTAAGSVDNTATSSSSSSSNTPGNIAVAQAARHAVTGTPDIDPTVDKSTGGRQQSTATAGSTQTSHMRVSSRNVADNSDIVKTDNGATASALRASAATNLPAELLSASVSTTSRQQQQRSAGRSVLPIPLTGLVAAATPAGAAPAAVAAAAAAAVPAHQTALQRPTSHETPSGEPGAALSDVSATTLKQPLKDDVTTSNQRQDMPKTAQQQLRGHHHSEHLRQKKQQAADVRAGRKQVQHHNSSSSSSRHNIRQQQAVQQHNSTAKRLVSGEEQPVATRANKGVVPDAAAAARRVPDTSASTTGGSTTVDDAQPAHTHQLLPKSAPSEDVRSKQQQQQQLQHDDNQQQQQHQHQHKQKREQPDIIADVTTAANTTTGSQKVSQAAAGHRVHSLQAQQPPPQSGIVLKPKNIPGQHWQQQGAKMPAEAIVVLPLQQPHGQAQRPLVEQQQQLGQQVIRQQVQQHRAQAAGNTTTSQQEQDQTEPATDSTSDTPNTKQNLLQRPHSDLPSPADGAATRVAVPQPLQTSSAASLAVTPANTAAAAAASVAVAPAAPSVTVSTTVPAAAPPAATAAQAGPTPVQKPSSAPLPASSTSSTPAAAAAAQPATAAAPAAAGPVQVPIASPAAPTGQLPALTDSSTGHNVAGGPSLAPRLSSPRCPAHTDQCDANTSTPSSSAYCAAAKPFTRAQCVGGCCISSGKCGSNECYVSGLGAPLPQLMCQGLGSYGGFGYDPTGQTACRKLACRLAVPGCVTGTSGGNCVGKVVALATVEELHSEGVKFLGYPCLETSPGDKPLGFFGTASDRGEYVARSWSVCDCLAGGAAAAAGSVQPTSSSGDTGKSNVQGSVADRPSAAQQVLAVLQGLVRVGNASTTNTSVQTTSGSAGNKTSAVSSTITAPTVLLRGHNNSAPDILSGNGGPSSSSSSLATAGKPLTGSTSAAAGSSSSLNSPLADAALLLKLLGLNAKSTAATAKQNSPDSDRGLLPHSTAASNLGGGSGPSGQQDQLRESQGPAAADVLSSEPSRMRLSGGDPGHNNPLTPNRAGSSQHDDAQKTSQPKLQGYDGNSGQLVVNTAGTAQGRGRQDVGSSPSSTAAAAATAGTSLGSSPPGGALADIIHGLGVFAANVFDQGDGTPSSGSGGGGGGGVRAVASLAGNQQIGQDGSSKQEQRVAAVAPMPQPQSPAAADTNPAGGFGKLAAAAFAALQANAAKAAAHRDVSSNSNGDAAVKAAPGAGALQNITGSASDSAAAADAAFDVDEDYGDGVITTGRYKGFVSSRSLGISTSASTGNSSSTSSSTSSGNSTGSSTSASSGNSSTITASSSTGGSSSSSSTSASSRPQRAESSNTSLGRQSSHAVGHSSHSHSHSNSNSKGQVQQAGLKPGAAHKHVHNKRHGASAVTASSLSQPYRIASFDGGDGDVMPSATQAAKPVSAAGVLVGEAFINSSTGNSSSSSSNDTGNSSSSSSSNKDNTYEGVGRQLDVPHDNSQQPGSSPADDERRHDQPQVTHGSMSDVHNSTGVGSTDSMAVSGVISSNNDISSNGIASDVGGKVTRSTQSQQPVMLEQYRGFVVAVATNSSSNMADRRSSSSSSSPVVSSTAAAASGSVAASGRPSTTRRLLMKQSQSV